MSCLWYIILLPGLVFGLLSQTIAENETDIGTQPLPEIDEMTNFTDDFKERPHIAQPIVNLSWVIEEPTRFDHPIRGQYIPPFLLKLLKDHENRDLIEETKTQLDENVYEENDRPMSEKLTPDDDDCLACFKNVTLCTPSCLMRNATAITELLSMVQSKNSTIQALGTCRAMLNNSNTITKYITYVLSLLMSIIVLGIILGILYITNLHSRLHASGPYQQVSS